MRELSGFFVPMAITSILMITTHSLFNAGLARLSYPEIYLAAFAVAKSLVHFIESPVMMVRQVVSTLVYDSASYTVVKKFMIGMSFILFFILSIMLITGGIRWIFDNIIGLEEQVLDEALVIFSVLIFFPFAAGLRNFMQGIAINLKKTPLFTLATVVRIIYVVIVVANIKKITVLPDGIIAGIMFFGAVLIEGLVLLISVSFSSGKLASAHDRERNPVKIVEEKLDNKVIFNFFGPLVLTAFMHNLINPLVNIGLARTFQPELAIATFAVAWGLGMIIISPMFMFHQVAIKYIDENEDNILAVKKFGACLAFLSSSIMIIIAYTNTGLYLLQDLIGASQEISLLSLDLLKIMVFLPILVLMREFYWGIIMKRRYTRFITKGKIVNLLTLIMSILVLMVFPPANPAMVGAIAILFCESAELLYLYIARKKIEDRKLFTLG